VTKLALRDAVPESRLRLTCILADKAVCIPAVRALRRTVAEESRRKRHSPEPRWLSTAAPEFNRTRPGSCAPRYAKRRIYQRLQHSVDDRSRGLRRMRFTISLAIVDATRKRDVPRHSCRGLRAASACGAFHTEVLQSNRA
jgi:hypothetical protein